MYGQAGPQPSIRALALVVGIFVAAAAAAAEPEPCDHRSPRDLRRICESGRLTVARYRGQRPPFFFQRQSGDWVGFDVDLARDIASRLGVDYRFQPAESFDQVVDLVADRRADVGISKLSVTLDRSQRVRFSKPYMTVYQTLLVNRLAAPKQEDPFRFLNRPAVRIGALEGSSYMEYAGNEFAAAQVVPYADFSSMMQDVTARALDAVFVDSARANTWRRNNPERLIQVRAFVARDRRDLLAMAVHWEDTHLLAWLDLFLNRIRDDGSARRLYHAWFEEAPPESEED